MNTSDNTRHSLVLGDLSACSGASFVGAGDDRMLSALINCDSNLPPTKGTVL
jgi:hypothetical protein